MAGCQNFAFDKISFMVCGMSALNGFRLLPQCLFTQFVNCFTWAKITVTTAAGASKWRHNRGNDILSRLSLINQIERCSPSRFRRARSIKHRGISK